MPNTNGGLEVLHVPVQQGDGKWQERVMDFFRDPRDTYGYACLLMVYPSQEMLSRRWSGVEVYLSKKRRATVICEWNRQFLIFGFSREEILATAQEIRLMTEGASVMKIDQVWGIGS